MNDIYTQLQQAIDSAEKNLQIARSLLGQVQQGESSQEEQKQTATQASSQLSQSEQSSNLLDSSPSSEQKHAQSEVTNTQPESRQPEPDGQSDTFDEEENIVIGKEGYFDGIFMIADSDEKKYQIPPNYVSKSKLVVGDRLSIVDMDETGSRYSFKQLTHVKRKELSGILTKKDNQWAVLTPEGPFYVVAAAIKFNNGEIGDKVTILVPDEAVPVEKVEWGALESLQPSGDPQPKKPPTPNYAAIAAEKKQPSSEQQQAREETGTPSPKTEEKPAPSKDNKPTQPRNESTIPTQQPATKPSVGEMSGEVQVHSHDEATGTEGEVNLSEDVRWELR